MPKTIIVGDIGGQLEVFHQVLKRLGIGSDYLVPEGLTVIQVGDVVRMADHRNLDSVACADLADKLIRKNPASWIQLLGNHESPFAGGAYPERWLSVANYDEYGEIVSSWVDDGLAYLAVGIDDSMSPEPNPTVITHAGLSYNYMRDVLKTLDPFKAVAVLNDAINDGTYSTHLYRTGAIIFDTEPNYAADMMWISATGELYPSWVDKDMGFHQITGHDIPYMSWDNPELRFPVPESFSFVADTESRLSITTTPENWTFKTVDWVLKEAKAPDSSKWGLREIEGKIIL